MNVQPNQRSVGLVREERTVSKQLQVLERMFQGLDFENVLLSGLEFRLYEGQFIDSQLTP